MQKISTVRAISRKRRPRGALPEGYGRVPVACHDVCGRGDRGRRRLPKARLHRPSGARRRRRGEPTGDRARAATGAGKPPPGRLRRRPVRPFHRARRDRRAEPRHDGRHRRDHHRADRSDFRYAVSTANGTVMVAMVELAEVRVGGITVRDVAATVVPGDALRTNLLGMSFLGRLSRFEMAGDQLVLHR
ncbi:MAG TPA: TIGR02281 family clan AA aspartic protease [Bauldia sp.]|nr:TIGR02281 family clan AA aspartic protease [Bauldia sp.]